MPGIHVTQFGGMVPAISPRLLDKKFAQLAINCDLRDGKINPWPPPYIVGPASNGRDLEIGIHPLYPATSSLGGRSGWLDPGCLDFVLENLEGTATANYGTQPAPYRNVSQGRVFFRRPETNNLLVRALNSAQVNNVGVTSGPSIFSVIVSGLPPDGSLPCATAYCATYVDGWGGEGAPGPSVLVRDPVAGQKVNMIIEDRRQEHTIGLIRLYRAISDFTSGEEVTNPFDTSWHLVYETGAIPGPFSFSYADIIPSHQIPGDTLISREFFPPPVGPIAALCELEGGWLVLVMVDGRVAISQRHQWHAWPGRNIRQLPSNKVLDAVAWGDTVMFTFSDRGPMRMSVVAEGAGIRTSVNNYREDHIGLTYQASMSFFAQKNLSLVKTSFGAIYGSPSGIISIGPEGAISNSTKGLVLPRQYATNAEIKLLPSNAVWHNGYYVTSVRRSDNIIDYAIYDFPDDANGSFADAALTILSFPENQLSSFTGECLASDRDRIVFSVGQSILAWGGLDNGRDGFMQGGPGIASGGLVFTWVSSIFVMPQLTSFSAVKISGLVGAEIRVKIFCDNRLMIDRICLINSRAGRVFRLPSGFKGIEFFFELSGTERVDSFHMATSVKELSEP